MSIMVGVVDDVRGFNRFYTRVLGLLRPDLAGSAFGRVGTDNLRISYANSRENLARALEQMGDFLEAL